MTLSPTPGPGLTPAARDALVLEQIAVMMRAFEQSPDKVLCSGSRLWKDLAAQHVELLRSNGFDSFKRTVNFHYHQWGVSVPWDPKLWRVFATFARKYGVPRVAPFVEQQRSRGEVVWPIKSRVASRVYRWFVGLVWETALREDELGVLARIEEPLVGSPLDMTYRGKLVSQDLAISALEANHLTRAFDLSSVRSVAEIGAGYGRLAHVLLTLFPHLEYDIFDIPPALAISQNYLARVLGDDKVRPFEVDAASAAAEPRRQVCLTLPDRLAEAPDRSFDLMMNISSLDEMSIEQIHRYLALIDQKARRFVYLKGHGERARKFPHRLGVKEFPYPKRWKLLREADDPIKSGFVERFYELPS